MKKIFYTILLVATALFISSCEKNPIGMTSTVDMAGDWYVMAEGADANGNVIEGMEDPFGLGRWHTYTYNTAKDDGTQMYVSDGKESDSWYFWQYAVKVNIDANAMTFQTSGEAANEAYECGITITGGKVILNGAKTPSGSPADSIVYYIKFSDDNYIGTYYEQIKVSGYRYTGLVNDD